MRQLLFIFSSFMISQSVLANPKCIDAYTEVYNNNELQELSLKSTDQLAQAMTLNTAQRVHILCDMKKEFIREYSAIDLKRKRINLDISKHFDQCIENESFIQSNDEFENLRFSDRTRLCLAKLQDTHVNLRNTARLPWVTTGIENIQFISGKYYITQVLPHIISYSIDKKYSKELLKIVKPGTEILEINGEKVSDYYEKVAAHISESYSSSLSYRAPSYMLDRNFFYPATNTVKLVLRTKSSIETVTLPWFSYRNENLVARSYLQKIGVPDLKPLYRKYKKNKKLWKTQSLKGEGYTDTPPLFKSPFTSYQTFYDNEKKKPQLRLAIVTQSGKAACYMQLNTFSNEYWHVGSEIGPKKKFIEPIEKFIKHCSKQQLSLIFDLRKNGGGSSFSATHILSALTPKEKEYGSIFYTARFNQQMASINQRHQKTKEPFSNIWSIYTRKNRLAALNEAIKKDSKYIPILSTPPIKASEKVGGYSQKIVTLVTPNCVSACDNMVSLLKKSGRSIIIGSHTNGTGAGFSTYGDPAPKWVDPFGLISIKIPNSLFGVLPQPTKEIMLDFEENKKYISENQPTFADAGYEYSTTLEDITNNGSGWAKKAFQALFSETNQFIPLEQKN